MIPLKIIPYKKWYLFAVLIFLLSIYHQAIFHVLFFDAQASDLEGLNGEVIKFKYLKGILSLNNSLFEFNFFQAFFIPLFIMFLGYIYYYLKNRYCRYYLGRTNLYYKTIKKLKLQLSAIYIFTFIILLVIIIITAILVGRFEFDGLEFCFSSNSIFNYFSTSLWHYVQYYVLVKSVAIWTETTLFFYLIDYFNHFSKSAFAYILYLWGTAPILYCFLPFYLVPTTHIMITSYGDISLWQILASNLSSFAFLIILKVRHLHEII